ncbi:hypothetical protein [Inovirus D_HF6_34]|nr:hypothetical protein [Inovirus D_HF6_34]
MGDSAFLLCSFLLWPFYCLNRPGFCFALKQKPVNRLK